MNKYKFKYNNYRRDRWLTIETLSILYGYSSYFLLFWRGSLFQELYIILLVMFILCVYFKIWHYLHKCTSEFCWWLRYVLIKDRPIKTESKILKIWRNIFTTKIHHYFSKYHPSDNKRCSHRLNLFIKK